MDKQDVIRLHQERGLVSKIEFLESLSEEDFNKGMVKFNIPSVEKIGKTTSGEGVWGWITDEDKKLYDDSNYFGKITIFLCNTPINFYGILFWGTEVEIKCNGENRPVISPEWVQKNILSKDWYLCTE